MKVITVFLATIGEIDHHTSWDWSNDANWHAQEAFEKSGFTAREETQEGQKGKFLIIVFFLY